jgi:hypothetical protein
VQDAGKGSFSYAGKKNRMATHSKNIGPSLCLETPLLRTWSALFPRQCAEFVQKHPKKKEEQEHRQVRADFRYHQAQSFHLATCTSSDIE